MENNYSFRQWLDTNVKPHCETRKGDGKMLSYLPWAWAWSKIAEVDAHAQYEITFFEGKPYLYDEKTGYMVFTKVTVLGVCRGMWLPVLDHRNRAMFSNSYEVKTKKGSFTVEPATMFDINKTIMRCLVKNIAMFGLGLGLYIGEDLPETDVLGDIPTVDIDASCVALNAKDVERLAACGTSEKLISTCGEIIKQLGPSYRQSVIAEYDKLREKFNK